MPEIVYGLFCEDIREEQNGKNTLIGTSSDRIFLHSPPPVAIRLAFHGFVRNPERQPYPFSMSLSMPGMTAPLTIEAMLPIDPNPQIRSTNLNWILGNLPITALGVVTVRISIQSTPVVEKTFVLDVAAMPAAQ